MVDSNQGTQQGSLPSQDTDQVATAANPLPETPKEGDHLSGQPKG